MLPEDTIRIQHILSAADDAISFLANRSRADLDTDRQLTHALVRCVEIIGEAAGKLSEEFRAAHPEIQWRAIIGMRNRLIHAYFDINHEILWRTVKNELPSLLNQLALFSDSSN